MPMNEKEKGTDILKVQGRMERGYGIIPKLPMQDKRLTIEAKAIYSYFCSYAGAGTQAFPSRSKILYDLGIGEERYYRHFNILKKYGYIKVEQNVNSVGKFKNNIYTLIEMIESHSQPYPENRGTVKRAEKSEKSYPDFRGTENPCTENRGTKNNNFKNNNFEINSQSQSQTEGLGLESTKTNLVTNGNMVGAADNNKVKNPTENKRVRLVSAERLEKVDTVFLQPIEDSKGSEKENKDNKKNSRSNGNKENLSNSQHQVEQTKQDNYNTYKEILQDNIGYSHYLNGCKRELVLVDELLNCMLDVVCSQGDTVRIGGEEKNRNMVKGQYLKINSFDIDHVLERFKEQRHKVTHVNSYLKTMLYTVKQEHGHYYANAVRADGVVR